MSLIRYTKPEDLEPFFEAMAKADKMYHIEDDPADIIRVTTDEPLFTAEEVEALNHDIPKMFEDHGAEKVWEVFMSFVDMPGDEDESPNPAG